MPTFDDFEGRPVGRNTVFFSNATEEVKVRDEKGKVTGKRWEDVEMIRIHIPADPTNVPHRKVTEDDKRQYAKEYEAWKAGKASRPAGMPVEELPGISGSQAKTLQDNHCLTVEQLAQAPASSLGRLGPGYSELSTRAQLYLQRKQENAGDEALAEKQREMENRLRVLEEENSALKAKADEAEESHSSKKSHKHK